MRKILAAVAAAGMVAALPQAANATPQEDLK